MFTGLIEKVANIENITYSSLGAKLSIKKPFECNLGDSISVNGVCLTVSEIKSNVISFDIMKDTLNNTILANLKNNDKINLERAMKFDGRFDGHFVSGHVDEIAKVKSIKQDGFSKKIDFICDTTYLIDKGSISVNGVSLTIQEVLNDGFRLSLIPKTQELTNLNDLKIDDKVNIEYDLIGKYIYKFTNKKNSKITLEFIKENGF